MSDECKTLRPVQELLGHFTLADRDETHSQPRLPARETRHIAPPQTLDSLCDSYTLPWGIAALQLA